MTPARMAHPRHHPRARRRARRPRGDRQPLRPRQRDPRHEALRLGLAGRPRRQRPALHRLRHRRALRRRSTSRCGARPAARSSSPPSRSTAGGAGRSCASAGGASDGGAIAPRWATVRRAGAAARARRRRLRRGVRPADCRFGSWGPTTEAWILAGSMLATYGMARGWVEFWLVWILVDVVGVTTLVQAGYYPTAGMYLFYAVFVVIGFVVWLRASPHGRRHERHRRGPRRSPA